MRIISLIAVLIIDIAFFIILALDRDLFNKSLDLINKFIDNSSSFLESMENPVLNWFSLFGNAFLITVIFVLIDFLIYFFIRTMLYFGLNSKEDSAFIKRFARQLKTFFFGIADGAMRLLLFLPDFLELIEYFLLGTDIDEMVRERYEEFDIQCDLSNVDSIEQNNSPSQSNMSPNSNEGEEE